MDLTSWATYHGSHRATFYPRLGLGAQCPRDVTSSTHMSPRSMIILHMSLPQYRIMTRARRPPSMKDPPYISRLDGFIIASTLILMVLSTIMKLQKLFSAIHRLHISVKFLLNSCDKTSVIGKIIATAKANPCPSLTYNAILRRAQ